MNEMLIQEIRQALSNSIDEKTRESGKRFFKEEIKLYGVKTAAVNQLAKQTWKEIKHLPKPIIFQHCEELWRSAYLEETFIACHWAYELRKDYESQDFDIFERWVNLYVNNWASCDSLCNHTVGTLIEMYPHLLPHLIDWTGSDNRWVRRAAAVSLIIPARRGKFLGEVFEIANRLLLDRDDLVQKGYGWMLKAASEAHQTDVFAYVIQHKQHMPRTALRYAIEKMPAELRAAAMKK